MLSKLTGAFQIVSPDFARWGYRPRLCRGLCPHKPLAAATIWNAHKLIPLILVFCCSCNLVNSGNYSAENGSGNQLLMNANPYKQIKDIPLPAGYKRISTGPDSFAAWLTNVSLKKDKTVYKFDGTPKFNQKAQFAVLNISVGDKDLQQCADALMRLRAEYLYSKNEFAKIVFTDNEGAQYHFNPPYSRKNFDNYLKKVFGMCGSASLQKQLSKNVEMKNIEPGDVLIHGGFPGHAVIVMDVAVNDEGNKIFLLAQSYMPAQDIHVLLNPSHKFLSPWYKVNDETIIETPEYTFTKYELKRW